MVWKFESMTTSTTVDNRREFDVRLLAACELWHEQSTGKKQKNKQTNLEQIFRVGHCNGEAVQVQFKHALLPRHAYSLAHAERKDLVVALELRRCLPATTTPTHQITLSATAATTHGCCGVVPLFLYHFFFLPGRWKEGSGGCWTVNAPVSLTFTVFFEVNFFR